jgi:hypothetical protein
MAGMDRSQVAQLEHAEAQRRAAKEDLLRPHLVKQDVFVESLGMSVEIRSLTQKQRVDIREQCGWGSEEGKFDEDKAMLLQIVACVSDPALTEEDVAALAEQSADIIDELNLHISMLNMMGRAGDLKKGSSPTENSDSL